MMQLIVHQMLCLSMLTDIQDTYYIRDTTSALKHIRLFRYGKMLLAFPSLVSIDKHSSKVFLSGWGACC